MDVRGEGHLVFASADLGDNRSFSDGVAARHRGRAELEQGDREAVGRLDRQRASAARHRTGERDDPTRGRVHRLAARGTDVDAPVLAAGVRVLRDGEGPENRSTDWPGPSGRSRNDHQ